MYSSIPVGQEVQFELDGPLQDAQLTLQGLQEVNDVPPHTPLKY